LKFNRVDLLALNAKGQLIIIELQNDSETDYFYRMLFGTAKAVTEYLALGDAYSHIKKVYSINIVYFNLGQGTDYVYHARPSSGVFIRTMYWGYRPISKKYLASRTCLRFTPNII
jgi:predicted transposase/invertase (TIGR01784 family)